MSIEEKKRLILALDRLIRRKTPGTAEDLGQRLQISRSTFFRLIDYMRQELSAPIVYDESRGGYVYEVEGEIVFGFVSAKGLVRYELENVYGGFSGFAPPTTIPFPNWRLSLVA